MRSNALLTLAAHAPHSQRDRETFCRGCAMRDRATEGRLRQELDKVLVRLARDGRALNEAPAEGLRLVGDMFEDAQVVAARSLDDLTYERLSRRARLLAKALERVRDGSYGVCEECGGTIPPARRRALPGIGAALIFPVSVSVLTKAFPVTRSG